MKQLKFESDIITCTDRYSESFALKDYIYDEDGRLDRQKTIDLLLSEEYGYVKSEGVQVNVRETDEPPAVPDASGYKKHVKLHFDLTKNGMSASFPVDLFLPDATGDIPCIVALDFSILEDMNYFPLEVIMEKKVAVARIRYIEVASDNDDFETGVSPLLSDRSDPHSAGKLSIWAYAADLLGNYLLEKGYAKKGSLYVTGHSRLGKSALLAAALYDIFDGVHSNCSGCCGAAISQEKNGETVTKIVNKFPYWFAPGFSGYAGRENEIPFDQHYLLALIAPKKLSIVTAEDDVWADCEAQYLAAEAVSPIYESMGLIGLDRTGGLLKTGDDSIGGNVVLRMRAGRHRFFPEDWAFFIDTVVNKK